MVTAKLAEAPPGAMVPRPFLVRERVQETADTWTLTLEPVAGEASPVAPGQFMMVYAFGIGEVPISASRTPNSDGALGLTVRSVGAVTDAICRCEPGQSLGLRGPFGNSWPVDAAHGADVLVVAGGIGLAPLRPVVLSTVARRKDYGTVVLLYGARTPADLLYAREFEEWRREISVEMTVDAAEGDWLGRVGVVSKLIARAAIRLDQTTAFVCGPEIMMRFTVDALRARGIAPERIHLSMERHMDCGVGLCGHCQLGPTLICRDGPVYSSAQLAPLLAVRQL
jgi:NAD(P)H-flavin reductase